MLLLTTLGLLPQITRATTWPTWTCRAFRGWIGAPFTAWACTCNSKNTSQKIFNQSSTHFVEDSSTRSRTGIAPSRDPFNTAGHIPWRNTPAFSPSFHGRSSHRIAIMISTVNMKKRKGHPLFLVFFLIALTFQKVNHNNNPRERERIIALHYVFTL